MHLIQEIAIFSNFSAGIELPEAFEERLRYLDIYIPTQLLTIMHLDAQKTNHNFIFSLFFFLEKNISDRNRSLILKNIPIYDNVLRELISSLIKHSDEPMRHCVRLPQCRPPRFSFLRKKGLQIRVLSCFDRFLMDSFDEQPLIGSQMAPIASRFLTFSISLDVNIGIALFSASCSPQFTLCCQANVSCKVRFSYV